MTVRDVLRRLRDSRVGPALNVPRRGWHSAGIAFRPARHWLGWLFASREDTNYTFPIGARNKAHLAHTIAAIAGCDAMLAARYIAEVEADRGLADHVVATLRDGRDRAVSDARADYAKRLGWYALVRIVQPQLVVETGLDKGLGAALICAALLRNGTGRYVGIDIDPAAGILLAGDYARVATVTIGDSLAALRALDVPIDLFVYDSDRAPGHELAEYRTIADKLSPGAIVLSTNAHGADALMQWSADTGRRFLFWQEVPVGHWYPGGGIGISAPA